jgi:hypothetical protein
MCSPRSFIQLLAPPLFLLCSGYLFAVLWFDLMADVSITGVTTAIIPEANLAPVAAYYRLMFGPMSWLVKAVMLTSIACALLQLTIQALPRSARIAAVLLNAAPVVLALNQVVPNALRLAARTDSLEVQSQLARSIYAGHVASILCIGALCLLELYVLVRLQSRARAGTGGINSS